MPASKFSLANSNTIPVPDNDKLIYALSCIRHRREFDPTEPPIENAAEKKHLKLLDGIALLLVVGAKADVAAVSFRQTSTSIDFFYAKNRPCTAAEKKYIESILGIVRSFDKSKRAKCIRSILDKAVRMCIGKVQRRIQKVKQQLTASKITIPTLDSENLGEFQIQHTSGNTSGTLSKAIAKVKEISKSSSKDQEFSERPEQPDERVLADYFRRVLTVNQSKDLHTDIRVVSGLIIGSYIIGMVIILRIMSMN